MSLNRCWDLALIGENLRWKRRRLWTWTWYVGRYPLRWRVFSSRRPDGEDLRTWRGEGQRDAAAPGAHRQGECCGQPPPRPVEPWWVV